MTPPLMCQFCDGTIIHVKYKTPINVPDRNFHDYIGTTDMTAVSRSMYSQISTITGNNSYKKPDKLLKF